MATPVQKLKGFVVSGIAIALSIFVYFFKNRNHKAIPHIKEGFKDHRQKIRAAEPGYSDIFNRLVNAYSAAKTQQSDCDSPYQVGVMWRDIVADFCAPLVSAMRDADTQQLQSLLENFQRERFCWPAGGAYGDYAGMQENPLYKYMFANTWYTFYGRYHEIADGDPRLEYPLFGNPAGLCRDGQVIPIDALRYHYYAKEVSSLLRDVDNPTVCEIGGGWAVRPTRF